MRAVYFHSYFESAKRCQIRVCVYFPGRVIWNNLYSSSIVAGSYLLR